MTCYTVAQCYATVAGAVGAWGLGPTEGSPVRQYDVRRTTTNIR